MTNFWHGKRVLVTGGSGFIGSHVVERLVALGSQVTATVRPNPVNLSNLDGMREKIRIQSVDLTRLEGCLEVCQNQAVVLNLAHADGSVFFKKTRPAYILRQNMLITLNMLEAASHHHVERFLVTSSAEVYPNESPVPTPESAAFHRADRLTDGYAWSKRMSELAARIWTHEHALRIAIARPNNIYGPRDYWEDEKGRVIPMFIKKAVQGKDPIVIWGTGETVRTFLYAEDLARGLLDLVEKYATCEPVNFGGEEEIALRGLAELIVRLSGSQVEIVCDATKPAGALRRISDTSTARAILGFSPTVSLEAGLRRTIDMYCRQTHRKICYSD